MATRKHPKNVNAEQESAFVHSDNSNGANKKAKKGGKLPLMIGCVLTLFFILGSGLYYYLQYQKTQLLLKNPVLASEMEQEKLVADISKLTQLPTNEHPTMAKVSDITKLHGQPFFQNAKNGDVVLIYPKAKEAILYDPTSNKIVQMGPIMVNQPSSQGAALGAQTSQQSVTVALYNGTTITGLTRKVQQELQQKMSNITVIKNVNANRQDYAHTIVIDLTGKKNTIAQQVAKIVQGSVGSLPSGESASANADIIIILGEQ